MGTSPVPRIAAYVHCSVATRRSKFFDTIGQTTPTTHSHTRRPRLHQHCRHPPLVVRCSTTRLLVAQPFLRWGWFSSARPMDEETDGARQGRSRAGRGGSSELRDVTDLGSSAWCSRAATSVGPCALHVAAIPPVTTEFTVPASSSWASEHRSSRRSCFALSGTCPGRAQPPGPLVGGLGGETCMWR